MPANSHEDRKHAPLPPSASSRWLKCAPSMAYVKWLIANKVIKKRTSGDAAQRGTRIHEMSEKMTGALLVATKIPRYPKGADPDEVQEAVDYAQFCYNLYLDALQLDADVKTGIETKAVVTEECWGSADFWLYTAGRLTVTDLKTGAEEVEVANNTQLLIYAMGVIREKLKREKVREVECVIYAPNAFFPEPSRSVVYSVAQFAEHSRQIMHGIEEATHYLEREDPDEQYFMARAVAGDQCRWCDALAVCPVAKSQALTTISENFAPVPVSNRLPDPTTMTPSQVGEVLRRAPLFSTWLEAIGTRAIELVQKGEEIPGYKVVQKITRRAYEGKLSHADVAKKLKVPLASITETRLLSPAKVEKILPKEKRKLIDDVTFRPVGLPTIVPESDRRQAIASSKIHFEPVTQAEEE